jgi:DNA-binding transcriptional regulator YdaS (Cro superfamily)
MFRMEPMDIHDKIVEVFGSQSELARILNIEPMAVSQWRIRGRIPAERCQAIAAASEGKIALRDLRPDIYGDPTKAA